MTMLARIALAVLSTTLIGVAVGSAGQASAAPTPVTPHVDLSVVDAVLAQPGVVRAVLLDATTGKVLADKSNPQPR